MTNCTYLTAQFGKFQYTCAPMKSSPPGLRGGHAPRGPGSLLSPVVVLLSPSAAQAPTDVSPRPSLHWIGSDKRSPTVCALFFLASLAHQSGFESHSHRYVDHQVLLFPTESHAIVKVPGLLTHSPADGHVGYFHFGAMTIKAAVNIFLWVFVGTCAFKKHMFG